MALRAKGVAIPVDRPAAQPVIEGRGRARACSCEPALHPEQRPPAVLLDRASARRQRPRPQGPAAARLCGTLFFASGRCGRRYCTPKHREQARTTRARRRPDRRMAQAHPAPGGRARPRPSADHRATGRMTVAVEQLAGALLARASRPDYQRFEAQLRSSGYCARPVRLRGHIEVCDRPGAGACGRPTPSRTACCARRAATAARPSAHSARSATAATPTSSSRPGCAAARACPSRWPSTRRCSSR